MRPALQAHWQPPARRRRRGPAALVMTLMRMLAVVVAVSSTGIVHAARDVADALAGNAHVDEDCSSDDDPSHDCPPGCPSCHGASGFVRALPPSVDVVYLIAPPPDDVEPWFVELRAPRQTDRSSIYRPPRATRLSS